MKIEIRRPTIKDLDQFHKQINDKEISKNIPEIKYPVSKKIAGNILKDMIKENKTKEKEIFIIEIDNNVGGVVGLTKIKKNHKAEVYYWIGKEYRRKGIMKKALIDITDLGFKKYNLKKIYATLLPTNKSSVKLLENCGYEFEKTSKRDFVYARIK